MIEIDGGAGGGQMLRNAVAISAITGQNFRMKRIRDNRPNPGIKRQHLEAVKAAARLCDAKMMGAEIGSRELEFKPGNLRNESFTANIGTAGSITLLFDTLLPITTQFSSSFRFTGKGGTDVKWSPTFSYFKQVKIPLLKKFGMRAETELERTGYYPKGGGEAVFETEEHSMKGIEILDRGELQHFKIFSKASKELEERDVADRQADETARKLKNSHISVPIEKNVRYQETASPGSSLLIKAVYENSIAGFDALGERGKRSEKVAEEAFQDFKQFHSSEAAVDSYMADQLIVFLAILGGEISIKEVTDHVQTGIEVVEAFSEGFQVNRENDFVELVYNK